MWSGDVPWSFCQITFFFFLNVIFCCLKRVLWKWRRFRTHSQWLIFFVRSTLYKVGKTPNVCYFSWIGQTPLRINTHSNIFLLSVTTTFFNIKLILIYLRELWPHLQAQPYDFLNIFIRSKKSLISIEDFKIYNQSYM